MHVLTLKIQLHFFFADYVINSHADNLVLCVLTWWCPVKVIRSGKRKIISKAKVVNEMPEKKRTRGPTTSELVFYITLSLQFSLRRLKKKKVLLPSGHSIYLASKEICPDICTRTCLFLTEVPKNQQKATKMKSFLKRSGCQFSYQQKEAYLWIRSLILQESGILVIQAIHSKARWSCVPGYPSRHSNAK